MNLVGLQIDIAWEDKEQTIARVRRMLEESPPEPGSIVVLPEMYSTGFSMSVANIMESQARPAEEFLKEIAQTYKVCAIGGVVNVNPDATARNQAVAFDPDGAQLVRYDKIHPFSLGGEAEHYTGGESVNAFEWQGVKVCPFVCYDLRFPEIFRSGMRMGAELFVVIANWPAKRDIHWTRLLEARAIENLAYLIGVNRCGTDPQHTYSGRSMIVDHMGRTLADAGADQRVITARMDVNHLRTWRDEFPALRDVRFGFVPKKRADTITS